MSEGKILVISGPAGSGKNTVLRKLLEQFPQYVRLVTATTRAPRNGEEHGVDHYFISTEEFRRGLEDGRIPEHWYAEKTQRYYGTYLPDLEEKLAAGKTVLTDVQIDGVRFFKKNFQTLTIFMNAESYEELERRVRARQPHMNDTELEERLTEARREVEEYAPEYDYVVVNARDALEATIQEVIDILRKEQYL